MHASRPQTHPPIPQVADPFLPKPVDAFGLRWTHPRSLRAVVDAGPGEEIDRSPAPSPSARDEPIIGRERNYWAAVLIAGQSIIKRQSRAGEQLSLRSSAQRPPGQLPKPAQPASSTGTSPASSTPQRARTANGDAPDSSGAVLARRSLPTVQVLFRPLRAHVPTLRAVNHSDDTEPSWLDGRRDRREGQARSPAGNHRQGPRHSLCGFIPRRAIPAARPPPGSLDAKPSSEPCLPTRATPGAAPERC